MSSGTRIKTVIADPKPSLQLFNLGVHVSSLAALGCFLLVLWQVVTQTPLPGKPGLAL